jgi:EAL and modified HD-GYP domain-containing signal transduction protein
MNIINISKQKIFDNKNNIYAYELVFKDSADEPTGLSSSVKGTSKLIISSISSKELDKLLGRKTLGFVNVDEETLTKGILDILYNKIFVLYIIVDIDLTD